MTLCCVIFLLYHCAGADKPQHAKFFRSGSPLHQSTVNLLVSLLDPNLADEVALVEKATATGLGDRSAAAHYNLSDSQPNCLGLDLRSRSRIGNNRSVPTSLVSYLDGSSWQGYLWIFCTSLGVAVAEALLILWLLRARAERIRTETTLRSNAATLTSAVRESEERFRLMADSAPVLMWVARTDKLRTDFNKEWLRFTGRTLQQESEDGWMQGMHPADLSAFSQKFDQAFEERQGFAAEYRLRRNDGRYRWLLDQGVPRFLENGDFAGYVGCGIDVTDQKAAEAVQAELGSRLIHAQEDERARIARELHDDINQRLALLANGIQGLKRTITGTNRAKRKEDLQALWRLTSEISADIQYLSHQLHPSKLHYLGLPAAMRGLCQEFGALHNIEIECVVQDTPSNLDENVSLSLYRTAQESLRNVAKHSHAQHVKVELMGMQTDILLRISDDGVGFFYDEATKGQGLGLVSMQERMRLVGGQFSVSSGASLGTQVEAIVPIKATLAQSA
jgi:PAS domain S-box-containing protein